MNALSHYEQQFDRRRIPFLYFRTDRKDGTGGYRCLFGDQPGKGWVFYTYHNQAGSAPGWALHRVWNFVLFAVHHIGEGKATDPQGWHVTFTSLKLERRHNEIALRWRFADTFRTGKRG